MKGIKRMDCLAAPKPGTQKREIPKDLASKNRPPFPYEQESEEDFARWRKIPGLLHDCCTKYTYFMRDRVSGFIKIGMARDPNERRARLSSSGAHSMEILLTLRGGDLEICYHCHFEDLRLHGEWFEPHPDILAEIARLTQDKE